MSSKVITVSGIAFLLIVYLFSSYSEDRIAYIQAGELDVEEITGTVIYLNKAECSYYNSLKFSEKYQIEWQTIYYRDLNPEVKDGHFFDKYHKPLYFLSLNENVSRLIVSELKNAGYDSLFYIRGGCGFERGQR